MLVLCAMRCLGFFIGATTEGLNTESRVGFLGRWQQPLSRQHCELPQTAQRFSTIFSTQDGLSDIIILIIIVDYHAAIWGGGQDPVLQ